MPKKNLDFPNSWAVWAGIALIALILFLSATARSEVKAVPPPLPAWLPTGCFLIPRVYVKATADLGYEIKVGGGVAVKVTKDLVLRSKDKYHWLCTSSGQIVGFWVPPFGGI